MCPIAVPLKVMTRFSMLKISGDPEKCTECAACVRTCPMDIRIPDYITQGKRVLSTECIICQTCMSTCPRGALGLSFRFDLGGSEHLSLRKQ